MQRQVGGHMQQSSMAAATALYDHPGHWVPAGSDAGDGVMAWWPHSAGSEQLATPLPSPGFDHLIPDLLMRGYAARSAEEKQMLFRLMRNLNFNGQPDSEPYTPTSQVYGVVATPDGYYSPEFSADLGTEILDLHSIDDTELLSEHAILEPFEPSTFIPGVTNDFDNEFDALDSRQHKGESDSDLQSSLLPNESHYCSRENNVAKVKVVVRKRPLNKKEIARKEDDIVTVHEDTYVTVHEPKLKVDLTAYVEKHEFCFDAVLDEHVTNDEVYRVTVEPMIPTIFHHTKATCFAYGQTGSGKTYTMKPLPLRASEDLLRLLHQQIYQNQRYKLWLSYFEIYGGKLYDLLSDRKKLCMRENGRQQVCIVGLQEFEVSNMLVVKELIGRGDAARSTGSTGANEESSRSHAILQLAVKKHDQMIDSRWNRDGNEPRGGKVVGKISFIDLAGNERGADTTDNDRQTRIEGAEINKSLLALKECIRALENDKIHIPFRGSKLTEVLRDSFVCNSRTVMISCVSPNSASCEHTLNTLRYADRVKSLSKTANPKKDQGSAVIPPVARELRSAPSSSVLADVDDYHNQHQELNYFDTSKRVVEKELSYNICRDFDRLSSGHVLNRSSIGREGRTESSDPQKDKFDSRNIFDDSRTHRMFSTRSSQNTDTEGEVQTVSFPRQRAHQDEIILGGARTYKMPITQFSPNTYTEEQVQKVSHTGARAYESERSNKLSQNTDKMSSVQLPQKTCTTEEVQKVSPPHPGAYEDERSYKVSQMSSTQHSQNSDTEEVWKVSSTYRRGNENEFIFGGSRTNKMMSLSQNTDTEEVQTVSPPGPRAYEDIRSDKVSQHTYMSTHLSKDNNVEEKLFEVSPPRRRASVDEITFGGSRTYKMPTTQLPRNNDTEEMQKVSPSHRSAYEAERSDKLESCSGKNNGISDWSTARNKHQNERYDCANFTGHRQHQPEPAVYEDSANKIPQEVEALIAAHRKEIEDAMDIIHEELKLLVETEQPGSLIDNYVTQLSFVLSRKAASLVSLQARVAGLQHRLRETRNPR